MPTLKYYIWGFFEGEDGSSYEFGSKYVPESVTFTGPVLDKHGQLANGTTTTIFDAAADIITDWNFAIFWCESDARLTIRCDGLDANTSCIVVPAGHYQPLVSNQSVVYDATLLTRSQAAPSAIDEIHAFHDEATPQNFRFLAVT